MNKLQCSRYLHTSNYFQKPKNGEPFLSRPFIDINHPHSLSEPIWLNEEQKKYSQILFNKPIVAHPVYVHQNIHKRPNMDIPQVAFVGRSNVGKSSLINALVYDKSVTRTSFTPVSNSELLDMPKYAPVSHKPGRTRHLFTFDLSDHFSLVDLPGYGFAKVSKELRNDWAKLIEAYLRRAQNLKRVITLIDGRLGPENLDLKLFEMLLDSEKAFQVVLTKVDLLKPEELHATVLHTISILKELQTKNESYSDFIWPFIHCISTNPKLGLDCLRCSLSAISSDYRISRGKELFKKKLY